MVRARPLLEDDPAKVVPDICNMVNSSFEKP